MDIASSLAAFAQGFALVLVALAITVLAKKADDWRTRAFDDDELIAGGNVALGIRRGGFLLGGLIAMAGVLSGPSNGFVADLTGVALFGTAAYVALFGARYASHAILRGGERDDDACARGNVAVGIVQFGLFVATGILVNGAVSGGGTSLVAGLRGFVLFVVLGQIVFAGLAFAFTRLTSFDDREELARGNRAVAVELAGMFVSIAVVLRAATVGPTDGIASDVLAFAASALLGAVALLAAGWVARRALLPVAGRSQALRDDNLAVALLLQSATLAVSILIASLF